ncbi:two-component system, chemotaxis family, sensor histidine kinase and response regulator WspE [Pararobbsia alpina]|uniref:hybrid sensor histidine kinase/response regulator n=1 Tax=Pararobbsia alpina TaxID=621374 RepID=UPI0039A68DBF
MSHDDDLSRLSLEELFLQEAQTQSRVLTDGLLALERTPDDAATLEACMRAAHSLKGAARIVGLQRGVDIAHRMEECFVNAQHGLVRLRADTIDRLLEGVDLLLRVAGNTDPTLDARIDAFIATLGADSPSAPDAGTDWDAAMPAMLEDDNVQNAAQRPVERPVERPAERPAQQREPSPAVPEIESQRLAMEPNLTAPDDRLLRVSAARLDRVLGLSGEALVEARWLHPFGESLQRVKRMQREAGQSLDRLHDALVDTGLDTNSRQALDALRHALTESQRVLGDRLAELEQFDRRHVNLSRELYDEALACRMRPFSDRTAGYARMVRDLARTLGKQARLEIVGGSTPVDRDILDMLDAPLGHLIRNALDHGIEPDADRRAAGKPAEGTITVEARHSAGKLQITVADDGAGIDLDALRAAVVDRRHANPETVARLSDAELLEFLFLPGFSMRSEVTDVSGRGVGLDVVQTMVRQVRGTLRIVQAPGQGTRFVMQLPLTLSVMRSLLVSIGDEPYAFPLAAVMRAVDVPRARIDLLEGQQHFAFEGHQVGLVSARQVLGIDGPVTAPDPVHVIVIGDERRAYGLVVDRFLGERMLVVQPLDSRLGKVRDITAGALMENGEPVLIVDVDDLMRSVEKIVNAGTLDKVGRDDALAGAARRKRVLVADDSLTVRELERKLLANRGYEVTVAVDGMDAWNALRGDTFDLVVTDVDMPRMDGIELVTMIRRDAVLKSLPVMIVSYKDREEDRQRGLDAGADYYLTKGSFHDETLVHAVHDLIGEPH